MSSDVIAMGAAGLARAIRSGEVSAREAVEAYAGRIEEVNPALNALVVPLFAEARKEADAADAARRRGDELGALHGVPITIKESFDVAGTPTTLGLSKRAAHRATGDAPTVARLRRAGAIVLGKTNVPQLVLLNETDNPVYGRTNNPHNPARSPGGSSGGCAALVAAGGTALSLGSDIGGSIRFPSHACGVQGLKPTANRLTMLGHAPIFDGQEAIPAQPGPLARSVEDLQLALRVLAAQGQETFNASIASVKPGDMNDIKPETLRVAVFDDNRIMRPAPAIRRAVREASERLRGRGVAVEAWTPPDVSEAWDIYQGLLFADGMAWARRALRGSRRDWRIRRIVVGLRLPRVLFRVGAWELSLLRQKHLSDSTRRLGRRTVGEYWRLLERRAEYRARFIRSLDAGGFDAVLCPPDALPALTHGSSFYLTDALSYSALFNLLGMPAGVVAATSVRAGEETDRTASRDI
ncbi:MAG TPA: amidase family protein, partial [Pyrinomonadaceae bacterium]|nr:amidase family protein [Pyrinomonadaceae bacterium]